ncbi:nucleotide sugar dehydrogenase [Pelagibacterales bacterium]|nr:nucleotide sugar dehydrogenase [Pelagibacterales bacterium]
MSLKNKSICIIGLGYVGLPLAVEFGKKYQTCGYDINKNRINELKKNIDVTLELTANEIKRSSKLTFTSEFQNLKDNNIFIITVPTPINKDKTPDLSFLKKASLLVGKYLKSEDIVIYESTVYPGATEEICVPILEKKSKLKYNEDFYCGYSPERINPGDKKHKITDIKKITSGSNKKTTLIIDKLYKSIIKAGTHKVSSIKVAESAKVIENTQRDVNIALINELAILFDKLNINTSEVLEAAGTKWNFLSFQPGLVGGHCIGVDPYYLTYKSKEVGHKAKLILAGREINNGMVDYVVKKINDLMLKKSIKIKHPRILIMGLTFKENCPDTRNSLVFDVINKFSNKKFIIDVIDPFVQKKYLKNQKFSLISKPKNSFYDVVLLAVAHDKFRNISSKKLLSYAKKKSVIYDIKNFFSKNIVDASL